MTGPIPFSTHPRRAVRRPDGSAALVAIRRDRHRRTASWWSPFDGARDLAYAWRRLRGDRSWRIELYGGVAEDLGALPPRSPDQRWVVADRDAAVVGAERLCAQLARGEPPRI